MTPEKSRHLEGRKIRQGFLGDAGQPHEGGEKTLLSLCQGCSYRLGGESVQCAVIGPKVQFRKQDGTLITEDIERVIRNSRIGSQRISLLEPPPVTKS